MAAGWLQETYDAKMVSVYRHPRAVALSEYERDADAPGSRTALLDSPTIWTGRYAPFRRRLEDWTEELRRFVSDTTSTHRDGYYATSRVSASRIGRWKSELTPEQIVQTLTAAAPFGVPFAE